MKDRYTQLIQIQRCLVGECEHEVTVRNINGRFHVRVFLNGVVNQEAVCASKADIGWTARSLLVGKTSAATSAISLVPLASVTTAKTLIVMDW